MKRIILVLVLFSVSLAPVYAQQPIESPPALEPLWKQVQAHPDDFSAACMPLDGKNDAVLYNADTPFPLASVSKVLIFIAYAQQLNAGSIPLNEHVTVATLARYDVPGTNRGAHEQFLAQYPAGAQSISLWDVAATGMIQYSSNAASDYVLARISPVDWTDLYRRLNLNETDYPHPLSMIPLLMNNHETGKASITDVATLSVESGTALVEQFVQDPDWRQAEVLYRANRRGDFPSWEVQARILQEHTATGTTADWLKVLAAVYGVGGPLDESTKELTRLALRWKNYAALDNVYVEYGSKLGFYSGGTLALVAYGKPHDGGLPVISAVFMRNIPRRTYNELLRDDLIGDLAHWLNHNACAGLLDVIRAS